MCDEMQTCTACGQTLEMTAFRKLNGYMYSRECNACRAKAKLSQPAFRLIESDIALLRLLRNHAGLSYSEIHIRIGIAPVLRVRRLVMLGLVRQDGQGFFSLTDAGRAHAPFRNRHLEARRMQQREEAGHV